MDDNGNEYLKKCIKEALEGMIKQLMQRFEVMATQLRGKMAAKGSSSYHHGNKIRPLILNNLMIW